MTLKFIGAVLIVSFVVSGCGSDKNGEGAVQKAKKTLGISKSRPHIDATPYLVKKVPADIVKLDVVLDNKIVLAGYTVSPVTSLPGGIITVTWYWKCLKTPKGEWEFFTHIMDADDNRVSSLNSSGQMRSRYKPQMWKPGQIIKDVETIRVPGNYKSKTLELRTGLWQGPTRMHVIKGPVDEEDRVKGPVIPISLPMTNRPVAVNVKADTVNVPFTKSAPSLGKSVEKDKVWEKAVTLKPFTDTLTGASVADKTSVKLTWDKTNLYVAIKAADLFLSSKVQKASLDLWKEDAFDIFIVPDIQGKGYFEFQIAPTGLYSTAFYKEYRIIDQSVRPKIKVSVLTDGAVNDQDSDTGWSAVVAIPWRQLEAGGFKLPEKGTALLANFYRINKGAQSITYSAWAPPLRGDFQTLDMFGKLVLQ